jgi:hypothetical protein
MNSLDRELILLTDQFLLARHQAKEQDYKALRTALAGLMKTAHRIYLESTKLERVK